MNSSVIVLDLGIFLWELRSLREKYLGPKQSPLISHTSKREGAQLLLSNSKTISRNIGVTYKVKYFMPEKNLYTLYCALVMP